MNHNEARLLIGGEPHAVPPELAEHLAGCPECTQFQREMLALDGNIRRALQQSPVSAAPPAVTLAPATPVTSVPVAPRRRRASAWSGLGPGRGCGGDLHDRGLDAASERLPGARRGGTYPVRVEELVEHRKGGRGRCKGNIGAGRCGDRHGLRQSHVCPQLPVPWPRGTAPRGQHPAGPVTVMVLPHESVKHRMNFHEDGMSGVITPAPHGSIAVIMQGNENVDAVAQQVQQSVRWLPPQS